MELVLLEVLIILLLLLINGIFSMSELAVVSARRMRLQKQAEKGSVGAKVAIELAENPNHFLSTVQIGITLIGIVAGAFGGVTIANSLSQKLEAVSFLAPYHTTISFALVIAAITYFSIVIGELIPKSLALSSPEKIATLFSRPMKVISTLAAPVVWLLSAPTGYILRFFKIRASVEPPVTDEEIKDLIAVGTEAGVFEETERELIASVISLGDQRITTLMTPRPEIDWLDLDETSEKINEQLAASRFSRLPVARGSLDNIVGYAAAKVLLGHLIREKAIDLNSVLRQPLFVPETLSVLELLERFQESHTHFALVVDEFGGVEGLVTLNDVVEAIIGELLNSQHSLPRKGVFQQKDNSLILDGRLPILEFKELLELSELPAEERDTYQTLAGFILVRFGKIPKVGDKFRWSDFEFEINSMDNNRIEKVSVRRTAKPPL
jgi:putative hemolysin